MEVGLVPGSTLVSSVKGKEGKDSGSNQPSAVKGKKRKDSGSNTCTTGYSIPLCIDKAYI